MVAALPSVLRRLSGSIATSPLAVAAANGRPRASDEKVRRAVEGRVILVTGSSFGIGEATARRLAACGATVLLVARTAERLEEVAAEIRAAGGTVHAYPADLTDGDQVDALVARIIEEHGGVDVLVNNAGKSIRRSIADSTDRFHDFQRTIDINYLAPVRLTMGLLPSMRTRDHAQLISISTSGVRGLPTAPRWSAYQASKSAFDVWTRSVAQEVKADGIATTSIYMGLVRTRMSAPTEGWSRFPGLSPEGAAGLVCDAIVYRPRTIAPAWIAPAHALNGLIGGISEDVMGRAFERDERRRAARAANRDEEGGG